MGKLDGEEPRMNESEGKCQGGYHKVIINIPQYSGYRQVCKDCDYTVGYTIEKVCYPAGYQEGQQYE